MKHFLVPVFLVFSPVVFVQDNFDQVYFDALNPYSGMTEAAVSSYQNPFGEHYYSTEKYTLLEKKAGAFKDHIYSFEEDSVVFERKSAAFQMLEFKVGQLTVRRYWPQERNAVYTECYDAQERLIAIHQNDVEAYAILDLNENVPSHYIVGDGLVLFSYTGNQLTRGIKYSLDGLRYTFDRIEGEELVTPVALFDRLVLEKMASPFFSKNEPHNGKYPSFLVTPFMSAGCDHGHICCKSQCDCCPDFFHLQTFTYDEIVDVTDHGMGSKNTHLDSLGRLILTKDVGQGVTLKAFVLPQGHPVYQFIDSQGFILAEYTSTLTRGAFGAAYSGASEFYEYNEKGEAWVCTADGAFCKINKLGELARMKLSAEELEATDYERISVGLYAVRMILHEHLPYNVGNYVEEKFEVIVLFNAAGELVRYTPYTSIEPVAGGLFVAGRESIVFSQNNTLQPKTYSLVDSNFNVLTSVPYELINPPGDGLMRVESGNGFGYIDRNGKEIIPCQYQGATVFENGRAYVTLDGKEFFINKSGQRIK